MATWHVSLDEDKNDTHDVANYHSLLVTDYKLIHLVNFFCELGFNINTMPSKSKICSISHDNPNHLTLSLIKRTPKYEISITRIS